MFIILVFPKAEKPIVASVLENFVSLSVPHSIFTKLTLNKMTIPNNNNAFTRTGSSPIEGILGIGLGIALPIFAWTKRPFELRDISDQILIASQNKWVLKPFFFYASFVVALSLIVYGVNKLRGISKKGDMNAYSNLEPIETISVIGKATCSILDDVTIDNVWESMTNMFFKRHSFWHPTYGDLDPITFNKEKNTPIEFITVNNTGSGGRHKVILEELNHEVNLLKFSKPNALDWNTGKSIVEPSGIVCSYYTMHARLSNSRTIDIEITLETVWNKNQKSGRFKTVEKKHADLDRELRWFSTGIPYKLRTISVNIIK